MERRPDEAERLMRAHIGSVLSDQLAGAPSPVRWTRSELDRGAAV